MSGLIDYCHISVQKRYPAKTAGCRFTLAQRHLRTLGGYKKSLGNSRAMEQVSVSPLKHRLVFTLTVGKTAKDARERKERTGADNQTFALIFQIHAQMIQAHTLKAH